MEKSFFIFFVLFIQINAEIINNPFILINSSYPFLLSTSNNDYYYVITSGKSLKIERETGSIAQSWSTENYPENFIYILDNSKNNFIYKQSN